MASPSADAGPSTAYIDDTPNWSPRSLDLISRIQERAWLRTLAHKDKKRRKLKARRNKGVARAGEAYEADEDDDDVSTLASGDETSDSGSYVNSQSWPSDTYQESDDYDQEQQWKEAMEQIDLAVRVVLCPLFGKYMGRQWALWGECSLAAPERWRELEGIHVPDWFLFPVLFSTAFSRYQKHGGLSMRFFGLTWVPETIVPSWLAIFSLSTGGA